MSSVWLMILCRDLAGADMAMAMVSMTQVIWIAIAATGLLLACMH